MFVVAGISGQTGGAAAAALLEQGHAVRAIVRDRAKAGAWAARGVDLVVGDAEDAGSLAAAFRGARGAYMLAPPQPTHPDPIGSYAAVARATREAARASGLERLVFLSSEGAHLPSGTGPIRGLHEAESVLDGSVPQLTFLRATYFQENWLAVMSAAASQGVLPTMLSPLDRRRAMVATRDIGQAAADLLGQDVAPPIVELAGPEDLSAHDVAEAFASVLGRTVTPVEAPRAAWVGILRQAGLGPAYAELLAEMYDGINTGHVRFSGEGVPRQGTTRLREMLAQAVRAQAA